MRPRDVTLDAISEGSAEPFTVSSPRSVEALARQGILVEELHFRAYEVFLEKNVPEELAQMRFEHHETHRRELIKQAQQEYKVVCTPAHSRGHTAASSAAGSMVDGGVDAQAKELHAMRKELEAMKNKQREDIVDQLMKDFRNQKLAELREQKEAAARAREEAQRREAMQRAKEWEALKLEREERKKEEDRLAEIERKKLAEAHFQQEKLAAQKAAAAETQRRKDAQIREEERMRKTEELNKERETYIAEQQRLADERKRQMDEKDRLREIAKERQNQELMMENKRKREETEARMAAVVDAQNEAKKEQERQMQEKHRRTEEKRLAFEAKRNEELAAAKRAADAKAAHIAATIEANDRREEAKKDVYRQKEAEALERLRLLAIEKQHEDKCKQQELDDKERARQQAIEKARADEEARKMSLLAKFEADSHKMDRVNAQRNRDMMIKNEQDRLRKQDKMDAVERLRRVEAFNREKQLQNIEADNQRIAEMNLRKYKLQQEKIQMRKEQDVLKKNLMAAVEKFEKTKVWQAPPGLDFELDVHEIKRQAEGQVTRSRENSQSSVFGEGKQSSAPKSAPKSLMGTPIKKKRAPLTARGRMQEVREVRSERALVPLPRSSGRPSSAHEPSHSYEQEIPEDTSGESPAHAEQRSAKGVMAEERGAGSFGDGAEWQQDYSEYDLVDVRQSQQQPSKDMLFTPSSAKELKVQKRRGRTAHNRAKEMPAWHQPTTDPLAPRAHTSGGLQGSSKTADAAYRPAKKSKKKALSQGPVVPSRHAAMQILDGLRRQQNEQLLAVLEEEQAKEAEREVRMADVFQQKDKARLERIFSQERSEASMRIIDLTARHERMLAQTMIQLGLS